MKKLFLIIILIVASVLRLYNLSSSPSGFNADEAALGYNAYSLLETGKDEHGHSWPINLESFGDFKPAGYAYILMPFIKIFGLTEFAVRLPSALFGVLAVLFIYLLLNELNANHYSLISSLLLAISPWHLHFSRGAWESNVATTMILIGTWAFAKWVNTKKLKYILLCTLHYALSTYIYQSARVIAPILGLGLFVLYFKEFTKFPKQLIVSIFILFFLLSPIIYSLYATSAASRLSGVGLLADEGPLNRAKELRGQHSDMNSLHSRIFHNRPVIYFVAFVKNYTDHFFGNFLFINGDSVERSRTPETGLLHFTDFILLFVGIFFLTRNSSPLIRVVWLWLFVAPLASAITFQTPSALRAHSLVIPIIILISAGGYSLKETPFTLKGSLLFMLAVIYIWQIARYLHEYYVHYPQTYPAAWEYGFKELVPYVESVREKYDKVLITDKYDQPYILFLFYSKYPPSLFQGHHELTFRDRFNFSTVRDYGNYHFASTPWDKVRDIHSSLIVAAPNDIPEVGVNIVKTINFSNGAPAFKIISN